MAMIRVFGNIHLNPYWAGKVTLKVDFLEGKRENTTTVFDHTGQNELACIKTTISVESDNPDKNAVERDNFVHDEIIRALNLWEDARTFEESLGNDS